MADTPSAGRAHALPRGADGVDRRFEREDDRVDVRFLRTLVAVLGSGGVAALVLAERGVLPPWAMLVAAGAGALVLAIALARRPRSGWDGLVVFVVALAWLGPGYDAALYGSDATVYYNHGAHVARSGKLSLEDPLLERLPHGVEASLFPSHGIVWGAARSRSPAGLVFEPLSSEVYSSFSQLPAVLLAFGWSVAGTRGAVWVTPLLAAGGLAAFFTFTRRRLGLGRGLVAVLLAATALPEIFFARLPMAEAAAQLFLWNGLLVLDTAPPGRPGRQALAGLALGAATLARPEYLVFLPIALGLAWAIRPEERPSPALWVPLASVASYAALLLFVLVPTHYREPVRNAWLQMSFWMRQTPETTVAAVVATSALGVLVVALGAIWMVRRGRTLEALRGLVLLGVVAWFAAYASRGGITAAGQGLGWMPAGTMALVGTLALLGLPSYVRRTRSGPAGLLASTIALVAAFHFLLASHTMTGSALWAARRLLPVVLPVLFAAAACGATAAVLPRIVRPGAIAAVVAAIAWTGRPVWNAPLFDGASRAARDVAALSRPGEVILVDPSMRGTLVEVPLLLVHGRSTVALRGSAGDLSRAAPILAHVAEPVVAVLPSVLAAPAAASPRGTAEAVLEVPGGGETRTLFRATAYEVTPDEPARTSVGRGGSPPAP